MATLQQLRAMASYDLDQPLVAGDVPASGVYWTRGQLNYWINEGYRQIYAALVEAEAPWLEIESAPCAFPAQTRSVSLQAALGVVYDPLKITGVWDLGAGSEAVTLGRSLQFVPYRQLEQSRVHPNISYASPYYLPARCCSWWGHAPMYLSVYPIPATALRLRIRWVPALPSVSSKGVVSRNAALVADDDEPVSIPAFAHETLAKYAVVRAKAKEESSDLRVASSMLAELKTQLLVSADERQNQNSRQVVITDGSDYESGSCVGLWWGY